MTNKKTSLAANAIASMDKAKEILDNHDQEREKTRPARQALIFEAYKVAKADHKLKARFFVFYVNEIVKKGSTLETVLPFFKQEIYRLFESGELKETDIDENTGEQVNADVVYNNLRRLFNQAKSRYERAKNPTKKGTDQRDNEIKAKSFFDNSKLSDIAEGFTMLKHDRKKKIIRTLFLQMDTDERLALLVELDTMKDQPIPEIDDIK